MGDKDMVTLFIVHGVIQYLDDEDRLVQQDDMRSRRRVYLEHCAANGIEPRAIIGYPEPPHLLLLVERPRVIVQVMTVDVDHQLEIQDARAAT